LGAVLASPDGKHAGYNYDEALETNGSYHLYKLQMCGDFSANKF